MATPVTNGLPLRHYLPGAVSSFELSCEDAWTALRRLTVEDLKAWQPPRRYKGLVDALIGMRALMGDR